MSPIVTETVAVRAWTMVVDATTSPPRAVTVDRGDADPGGHPTARVDVSSPAGPVETADHVALALAPVVGDGEPPTSTVMIVPADTARDRFGALGEGALLAGLPAPAWVPDAVAEAGAVLADGEPDHPYLVVDARSGDIQAWGVRPTASPGRVGAVEPLDIAERIENLVIGIVRAKLGGTMSHPAELSTSPAEQPDLGLRRAAAQLRRDLRHAARRLAVEASGHGQIVVTVDDVEVTIESRELGEAIGHAAREAIGRTLGGGAADASAVVVVADAAHGLGRHLATAIDATIVTGGPAAALDGAMALVRARPRPARCVRSTSGLPSTSGLAAGTRHRTTLRPLTARHPHPTALGSPGTTATTDEPRAPRPRWAVPALTSLVAAALVGAGATLVTGAAAPDAPATLVPAGAVPAPAAVLPAAVPASAVSARPVVAPAPRHASGTRVSR